RCPAVEIRPKLRPGAFQARRLRTRPVCQLPSSARTTVGRSRPCVTADPSGLASRISRISHARPDGARFFTKPGQRGAVPWNRGLQYGVQQSLASLKGAQRSMLVLSRKLGEKICIGDNISITIVDIDRGKVRLGIEAPRSVPVYRQELLATQPNAQPATNVALTK